MPGGHWIRRTIKCVLVEMFDSVKPDDNLDLVDAANELLEGMKIRQGLLNPLRKQIMLTVVQINLLHSKCNSANFLVFLLDRYRPYINTGALGRSKLNCQSTPTQMLQFIPQHKSCRSRNTYSIYPRQQKRCNRCQTGTGKRRTYYMAHDRSTPPEELQHLRPLSHQRNQT